VTDSATFTTPEAGDEDLGDLLLEVLPPVPALVPVSEWSA